MGKSSRSQRVKRSLTVSSTISRGWFLPGHTPWDLGQDPSPTWGSISPSMHEKRDLSSIISQVHFSSDIPGREGFSLFRVTRRVTIRLCPKGLVVGQV